MFEVDNVKYRRYGALCGGYKRTYTGKKHTDSKIVIRSIVKSPEENAEEILDFGQNEGAVSIKYNKIGNISISHEIFLPAVKFKSIKLFTKTQQDLCGRFIAENFEAVTSNSNIDLMGVTGDKVNAATKNGRINFGYIIGREINIKCR